MIKLNGEKTNLFIFFFMISITFFLVKWDSRRQGCDNDKIFHYQFKGKNHTIYFHSIETINQTWILYDCDFQIIRIINNTLIDHQLKEHKIAIDDIKKHLKENINVNFKTKYNGQNRKNSNEVFIGFRNKYDHLCVGASSFLF